MAVACIQPFIASAWDEFVTETFMLSNSDLLKHLVPILCQFYQDDAALREEVRVGYYGGGGGVLHSRKTLSYK